MTGERSDSPHQGATATGRHVRDLVRLVVAVAVVTLAFVFAGAHTVDPVEAGIYRDIARLPTWSEPIARGLNYTGTVAAIAGAAGLAFFLKRVRLGTALVVAGSVAWVAGHLSQVFVSARQLTVAGRTESFRFPADHMAIAAALATVATPYLPRALRRWVLPLVALVALAQVFVGHHLPLDVLAGAFIGWFIGTAIHLAAGAPGRATSTRAVEGALVAAGIEPIRIEPVRTRMLGPTLFRVETVGGRSMLVEVVRRGQRRAGWGYKLRRLLASLEVEDEPGLSSPSHEVEHEAFVTLMAERAGVRTPPILLAGELGHGPALLVRERISGRRLHEVAADECDDDLLDEIWRQVAVLGVARIAHHDLRAQNILIDEKGDPWVLDFTFAKAGAAPQRTAQDVAEMLISLTAVVGAQRAIDAAVRVVPEQDLRDALIYLQPLALPARIRQQLAGPRAILADLSSDVARRLGTVPPSFRPRIRASTVLALAVGGGAVYLLLPQIAQVPRLYQSLREANYWWLVAAFLAGAMTFPMAAASYAGAVRRHIPFWRTTVVQVASAFTSRLTPGGVGGMGLNMIYLERLGNPRSETVGSIALNQAAGVVVHASGFFLAVAILGASGVIGKVKLPHGWPVLVAVLGVLVVLGAFLGSPFGRRRILRPGVQVGRDLIGALRHPVQALALFGGSAGVTLGNALALATTLAAFDPHFSLLTVMAVYVGGSAIASAAPTPGNLGAVEAALAAGLTGVGVASEPAVAAVLTFRLLTFWLPILPGMVAFRWLQHRRIV